MAVPKKKTSKSKVKKRRLHQNIKISSFALDMNTGNTRLQHHISNNGFYNSKKIKKYK